MTRKTPPGAALPAPPERPAPPLDPLTVRIDTALRLIGIGRTKLYELIGSGDIETIKIGKRTLVLYASLKRLIARGGADLPTSHDL